MEKQSSKVKVSAALRSKADAFNRTFSSKDGKQVLEWLRLEFDPLELYVPGDSHGTARKVGCRDVYMYVKRMMEYSDAARRTAELEGQPAPRA